MSITPPKYSAQQFDITPLKHAMSLLSNLSLTSEKKQVEDLQQSQIQNKRLNTDEDVHYSYSKLSNLSAIYSQRKHEEVEELYVQGNYTRDQYDPRKDYPPKLFSLTLPKTVNSTQDPSFLNQKISQDQKTIHNLQKQLQEKDQMIIRLKEFSEWVSEQNESLTHQCKEKINECKKHKNKLDWFQKQITDTEEQLHNVLKKLGLVEKENTNLKTQQLILDQQQFQQQQKLITLEDQNSTLEQENQVLLTKLKQNESNVGKTSSRCQEQRLFLQKQDEYIFKLESQLALKKKESNDHQYSTYQTTINHDVDQMNKFVNCIIDMVTSCSQKTAEKPSLKRCWKWLKNILEEYMHLKKYSPKEPSSSFFKNSNIFGQNNKRHQTSVDPNISTTERYVEHLKTNQSSENKTFRSNTTKQ